MDVKTLKAKVDYFNECNAGGQYSSRDAYLMFDCNTGDVWCDEFCNYGHNDWIRYDDDSIFNIVTDMHEKSFVFDKFPDKVTAKAVRQFINVYYPAVAF